MRYTPIPVEDGLASLSAILMDDDYYQFTIKNSDLINGLHIATTGALIALKTKAYLDLTERKANGANIDTLKINKHRNDVVRLLSIVSGDYQIDAPKSIKESLKQYISLLKEQDPEMKDILNDAGLVGIKHAELLDQINVIFSL
jgi:hypothetical protein